MSRPRAGAASSACQSVAAGCWHRQLWQRTRLHRRAKALGTVLGIAGFFPLYFGVMHAGAAQAMVMPLTRVDGWFALHEAALPLYASLWLCGSLPAAFAQDRARLIRYAAAAGLTALAGLAFFWLAPTSVPPLAADWTAYPWLVFLKSSDAVGNAFPSLHVAFAVLACGTLQHQLRSVGAPPWAKALNLLWAAGIVYSTLATGQHVALDVIGGLALPAAVCGLLVLAPPRVQGGGGPGQARPVAAPAPEQGGNDCMIPPAKVPPMNPTP